MFRTLSSTAFLLLSVFLSAEPVGAQITSEEYAARRDSVAGRMGEGALLAFGAPRPTGAASEMRQLPAFNYLTGFQEPDAVLVLVNAEGRLDPILFTGMPTVREQLYDGFREDPASLARRTGFQVRPLSGLTSVVDSLVEAGLPLFQLRDFASADDVARDTLTRGRVFVQALEARHPGLVVEDVHPEVDRLRARKSPGEIDLLRRAVDITEAAHGSALDVVRPGVWEYQVEAAIEHTFRHMGADGSAFASIVGSGPNSTTLHYVANDRRMEAGDLVVMDIGAQVEGYAADLTRTLPVSGRFTSEQRAIYDLVLESHEAAAREVGPGARASASLEASQRTRLQGMARLGLIESPDATYDPPWPVNCEVRPSQCLQGMLFMIHGISHGIGLEVHDVAAFSLGERTYQPGDVFTIEPGIYVNAEVLDLLEDTPRNRAFVEAVRETVERYHEIGVRIEDDYLVTAKGVERLSTEALRRAEAIEAAMAGAVSSSRVGKGGDSSP